VLNSSGTKPWRRIEEWKHSSTILDIGTRWRRVVRIRPRLLYRGVRDNWYPFDRRLVRPQGLFGRCTEQKNLLPLPWIVLGRPGRSPPQHCLNRHGSNNSLMFSKFNYYCDKFRNVQHCRSVTWNQDPAENCMKKISSDWLRAGVRVPVGSRMFSSPRRPDGLWGSTQPPIQCVRGGFPRE
jgi:hypothetical protein